MPDLLVNNSKGLPFTISSSSERLDSQSSNRVLMEVVGELAVLTASLTDEDTDVNMMADRLFLATLLPSLVVLAFLEDILSIV